MKQWIFKMQIKLNSFTEFKMKSSKSPRLRPKRQEDRIYKTKYNGQ